MKLLEKIQKVRLALQAEDIKATGSNRTFKYFELEDILPAINKHMAEVRMLAIPSFNQDYATMTAYDLDSEEQIVISSPMGSAKLAGCHEVQNIGAVETYQRRYLYLALFDINEKDMLDGSFEKGNKKPVSNPEEQNNTITVICDKCGKVIKGYRKKDGTEIGAEEAKEKCGGLCAECYLEKNVKEKAEKANKTQIVEVEV